MSHLDVDVIDFLLLATYPAAALFLIEMASILTRRLAGRPGAFPTWIKLLAQGTASVGFAAAYVTLITAHWLTSIVLLALAVALFYQAKRAKADPAKTIY